ncbi:MAG: DUF1559 domain-containing protein [Candidatus Omnitrophica bacterium]|nr:DUF1559 domain-containing protein [Candidatus Omnitrophota bacterium]
MNNLKQLGIALHMYANDYDGWLPPYGKGEAAVGLQIPSGGSRYMNPWEIDPNREKTKFILANYFVLTPEYIPVTMLFCPGGTQLGTNKDNQHVNQGDRPARANKAKPGLSDTYVNHNISYSYNPGLRIDRPEYKNWVVAADQNCDKKSDGSDAAGKYIYWNRSYYAGDTWLGSYGNAWAIMIRVNSSGYIYNHGFDGVNALFMDGSVFWFGRNYTRETTYWSFHLRARPDPIPGMNLLKNP